MLPSPPCAGAAAPRGGGEGDALNADMAPTAKRIMEQVLAVQPGERLVIVTDFERPRSITDLLTTTGSHYGLDVVVVAMHAREMGGEEPPPRTSS